MALVLHEGSICRCGQPASEAHDPDSEVEYEATDVACRACALLEEANDGPSVEKGIHWMLKVHRPSGVAEQRADDR